ncbi:MAG: hypothetical protein A2622_09960 [Bdellovibrionales bacterium RIFCSPHIGHO2_01_FULL_40_29]|nr:MAG: hypothetical protein A2622_09960 [Bdellovibrionales bacterium RIFCSPHIGHO2_01_FULL_40_29]OFZ32429.1 MAG: hypothetical protein A3D17_12700 [Bdellovibrionales bacterium RIFCSPHIGHO2_02_FULL_40_15]
MNAIKPNKTASKYGTDAFSHILWLLKMNVSIYQNAKICGNWQVAEREIGSTCFHIVTAHECYLKIPKIFDGIIKYGDMVIFPKEVPHTMGNTKKEKAKTEVFSFQLNKTSNDTGLLCGEIIFNHRGSDEILKALPTAIIIPYEDSKEWLTPVLDLIIKENLGESPAKQVILNSLSELLFIYALRYYIQVNQNKQGLLSIYANPQIARAMNQVHLNLEKNWSLESLAKEAGLSRTTFAQKFKQLSGQTPFEYLTWLRMQLAWSLLSQGELVSEVASQVGYQSESAFSHVFKKQFSISAGKIKPI